MALVMSAEWCGNSELGEAANPTFTLTAPKVTNVIKTHQSVDIKVKIKVTEGTADVTKWTTHTADLKGAYANGTPTPDKFTCDKEGKTLKEAGITTNMPKDKEEEITIKLTLSKSGEYFSTNIGANGTIKGKVLVKGKHKKKDGTDEDKKFEGDLEVEIGA